MQFQLHHITALALAGIFSPEISTLLAKGKLTFPLMCEKSFQSFCDRIAPSVHSRQRENVKGNAEFKDQMREAGVNEATECTYLVVLTSNQLD